MAIENNISHRFKLQPMKYLIHLPLPPQFTAVAEEYLRGIRESIDDRPALGFHSSLMRIMVNPGQEYNFRAALAGIRQPSFSCVLEDRLKLFDGGSLVVKIKPAPLLMQLHTKIIDASRPFIDWKETPPLGKKYARDAERQAVYHIYGAPYYASLFEPHISLCSLKENAFAGMPRQTSLAGYTWIADRFLLSKKGGTWEKVQEFKFQS